MLLLQTDNMCPRREGLGYEPEESADCVRGSFNLYLDTTPVVKYISSQPLRSGKVINVRAESHPLDDAFNADPDEAVA